MFWRRCLGFWTVCVAISVLHGCFAIAKCCYVFPNDIRNPCEGVTCRPGALCQPSKDGSTSECVCPTSCPTYGDHVGSREICASDSREYSGDCEMRKAACESAKNITIKFFGKCDPCLSFKCTEPEVCQLDEQRKPVCRCGETCPLEFTPICASDGKTYSNTCQMEREACRSRKPIRIMFRGQCGTGDSPCTELQCRNGAECRIENGAAAKCVCERTCERVYRPVCGTDHRIYDSECELKKTACRSGSNVDVAYSGICGSATACSKRKCSFGGVCKIIGGRAACRCEDCSSEFAPVCGSDGITYGNRCQLKLESCSHKRIINVLYDGPCNGCEHKSCEYFSKCETDGASETKCVCPENCDSDEDIPEVCGNDGRTYVSFCELKKASCREKRIITVKHLGNCESCRGIACGDGAVCVRGACKCGGERECTRASYEPVCSTRNKQYPNECSLRREACLSSATAGVEEKVAYYGECSDDGDIDGNNIAHAETEVNVENAIPTNACANVICAYEATCTVDNDGAPKCLCQFDCDEVRPEAVCASDLRLYTTLCHMKQEACRRQEDLRLRPLELCRGLEVKPCGGDNPMIDGSTGSFIDCGNGPNRKDCPSGSYCHQTSRYARCCRKGKDFEVIKKPEHQAAPSRVCGCNKLGSHEDDGTCEATGRCRCRPGVGGDKCDRCEPGFWGLASRHRTGCIPCGCSAFGAVREDCEQMTGRCVCKPNVQGHKCTLCNDHKLVLGPNGCIDPNIMIIPPSKCENLPCYFGAACSTRGGIAACSCPEFRCPPTDSDNPMVCGSDGKTYASSCDLKRESCASQSDVVVQALGPCAGSPLSPPPQFR